MIGAGEMDKKYAFLLLLVAQNTSKTLILRFALGGKGKGNFLYSAAVLATEGLKATSSCIWVLQTGGSVSSIIRFMRLEWRMLMRVMIPAGIYNCQQMLEFVALSRLEAPVFSVIVQTKLLTTALFSWLVLGKRLYRVQLIALVLLMVGVILAQMRDGRPVGGGGGSSSKREMTVGVVATLTIATLSGFAAVYTERVLKHGTLQAHSMASQDVLPYMQIQMAVASLLIIGVFAVVRCVVRQPLRTRTSSVVTGACLPTAGCAPPAHPHLARSTLFSSAATLPRSSSMACGAASTTVP